MFLGIESVVWELIGLLMSFTALGILLGRLSLIFNATEEAHLPYIDRAMAYAAAVDNLETWCGAVSPHARLIAKHLKAIGDGGGLNSGTPNTDEPCTIMGLREQIVRLDGQLRQSKS